MHPPTKRVLLAHRRRGSQAPSWRRTSQEHLDEAEHRHMIQNTRHMQDTMIPRLTGDSHRLATMSHGVDGFMASHRLPTVAQTLGAVSHGVFIHGISPTSRGVLPNSCGIPTYLTVFQCTPQYPNDFPRYPADSPRLTTDFPRYPMVS